MPVCGNRHGPGYARHLTTSVNLGGSPRWCFGACSNRGNEERSQDRRLAASAPQGGVKTLGAARRLLLMRLIEASGATAGLSPRCCRAWGRVGGTHRRSTARPLLPARTRPNPPRRTAPTTDDPSTQQSLPHPRPGALRGRRRGGLVGKQRLDAAARHGQRTGADDHRRPGARDPQAQPSPPPGR